MNLLIYCNISQQIIMFEGNNVKGDFQAFSFRKFPGRTPHSTSGYSITSRSPVGFNAAVAKLKLQPCISTIKCIISFILPASGLSGRPNLTNSSMRVDSLSTKSLSCFHENSFYTTGKYSVNFPYT